MDEQSWLIEEIKACYLASNTYEKKAFFQEVEKIVREQIKRIEQAEGELDGSLWSPKKW